MALKIDLSTPIKDNRGKDVIDDIMGDDGKVKKVKRTLKENLLRVLGQQYDRTIIQEPKECTWVYSLSTQCNGKENIIEIDDEKAEFLRKLIRNNKFIYYSRTPTGMTQQEASIFIPFEAGQILALLGEGKEEKKE